MQKCYYVYILASRYNGTLYVGVTSNLIKRIWQHKNGLVDSFSKKYSVKNLVYYEQHLDIFEVVKREKRLKDWKRAWKLGLINKFNKNWDNLYYEIIN